MQPLNVEMVFFRNHLLDYNAVNNIFILYSVEGNARKITIIIMCRVPRVTRDDEREEKKTNSNMTITFRCSE